MSRRLGAQVRRQVHRRDPSKNLKACEPCGQPSHLTRNTVAALFCLVPQVSGDRDYDLPAECGGTLEHAQTIASRESPRTSKLYTTALAGNSDIRTEQSPSGQAKEP
jgi:hypothetical protein